MMPRRKTSGNASSLSWLAEKAARGAAKAIPVSTPTGRTTIAAGRQDGPEGSHDDQVGGDRGGHPGRDPHQVAGQHVADPERGGQHPEVGAAPT